MTHGVGAVLSPLEGLDNLQALGRIQPHRFFDAVTPGQKTRAGRTRCFYR